MCMKVIGHYRGSPQLIMSKIYSVCDEVNRLKLQGIQGDLEYEFCREPKVLGGKSVDAKVTNIYYIDDQGITRKKIYSLVVQDIMADSEICTVYANDVDNGLPNQLQSLKNEILGGLQNEIS